MGNKNHKQMPDEEEEVEYDPPRVVSLIHENQSNYGTYQPMVDHFQQAADRRKLRKMFGILESMPGSEKLFCIKEMFYMRQLQAWLLYFRQMYEIPELHRKDEKLLKKLIEKLEALSNDFPANRLLKRENDDEVVRIEREFRKKYGFIALEPPDVPKEFDFSGIFTEKHGKWGHPKLPSVYYFKTHDEEKMFEIIEKTEKETRESIEKMTESSEIVEDLELENMWNRRIENKILQVKFFSFYPN